jgi:hypothetical protein
LTAKPAKSTPATLTETNLQGMVVRADDPAVLRHAIELAFHYRGDVTITRQPRGDAIEGYLFDRRVDDAGELIVRMIPKDSDACVTIPFIEITSLVCTGKDTASGKTFENWIRKYAEKKLAGETASIESESLDEE